MPGTGRSFLVEFITDAAKAIQDFNAAGESLEKIRKQLKGSDKEFDVFSTGVWGTAAALQAFTIGTVWAGASVETAMVSAGTSLEYAGTSAKEMGAAFLAAGKDATALLSVSSMAAKLGREGKADIEEFTLIAETMGYAFGISSEAAGDSLAKLGAATGKSNQELAKLASGMVALEDRALVSRGALEMLVLRTADVAKAAGVSEAPIMAMAAAFEQKGIKARMAIQPISKMVELLGKGRIPGIQLARAIGLSGERLEEWKKMKPEERMALFTSELAKMKPEKAAQKLEALKISSGKYAKQIVGAFRDTKKFNEMMAIAAEGMADTSALEKAAAEKKATLTNQIKDMWKALKSVGQEIGLKIIPVVTLFIQGLTFLIGILKKIPTSVLTVLVVIGWLLSSLVLLSKVIMASMVVATFKSISALIILAAAHLKVAGATELQTGATYKNAAAQMAATKASYAQFIATMRLIPAMIKQVLVLGGSAIAYAAGLFWRKLHIKAIWQEFYACLAQTAAATKELIVLAAIGVKTVVVTTATLALAAATWVLKIAQGGLVGVGSSLVKGLGALIPVLLGTATAAWAAAIPILIILAKVIIVIAIIVALIVVVKIVTDWMMTWGKTAKTLALIFGFFVSPIIWLVFSIRLLVKHWDEFVAAMIRVWDGIKMLAVAYWKYMISPITLVIWLVKKLTDLLAGSGLEEALGKVSNAFANLAQIALAPLKWIWAGVSRIVDAVKKLSSVGKIAGGALGRTFKTAGGAITAPLRGTWDLIKAIGSGIASAVRGAWGWLFGSSFLHIAEGAREVLPFVSELGRAISDIGRRAAAITYPATPGNVGSRIAMAPVGAAAAVVRGAAIAAVASGAGARREGAAAVAGERGAAVKVTIPVSVVLDGMVLARALTEYIVELRAERSMNEPGYPLRGVEPAY